MASASFGRPVVAVCFHQVRLQHKDTCNYVDSPSTTTHGTRQVHLRIVYDYFHYRNVYNYFLYDRYENVYFLYIVLNPNRSETHASKV